MKKYLKYLLSPLNTVVSGQCSGPNKDLSLKRFFWYIFKAKIGEYRKYFIVSRAYSNF